MLNGRPAFMRTKGLMPERISSVVAATFRTSSERRPMRSMTGPILAMSRS